MALSDAQIKALRKEAAGRKRRTVFHSEGQLWIAYEEGSSPSLMSKD